MTDDYLSVTQVAHLKNVSRNAVYKAVQSGRLISIRLVDRIAIKEADAQAWLPRSRTGRQKGGSISAETKAKISASQRLRWQNREKRGN